MSAQVLIHPALREQLLAERHAEVEHCREQLHGVTEGAILPEEIDPAMTYWGAKQDAIETCRVALEWAERDLAELEARVNGMAAGVRPGTGR